MSSLIFRSLLKQKFYKHEYHLNEMNKKKKMFFFYNLNVYIDPIPTTKKKANTQKNSDHLNSIIHHLTLNVSPSSLKPSTRPIIILFINMRYRLPEYIHDLVQKFYRLVNQRKKNLLPKLK